MRFKVTKQYLRGSETQFAQFTELAEAKFFVQAKLEADASLNVKVIYRIFEFTELVAEFDPTNPTTGANQSSGSAQGKSSEANFRPSPLSTGLRPAGMPQNWKVDKDDNKK